MNLLTIIEELKNHYDLVIYLFLFFLIIICMIIFFFLTNKKKRYSVRYNKLNSEFEKINKLNIGAGISKIEDLAARNISFANLASNFTTRYIEFTTVHVNPIHSNLNSVKMFISNHSYDKANQTMNKVEVELNAYRDACEELLNEIKNITKEEEPLLRDLQIIKDKFIDCKKKYQDNMIELSIVSEKILKSMDEIDMLMSKAMDNIRSGLYFDTQDIVNTLAREVDYLQEYLRVMPGIINLATQVVAKNLNELIEKNNSMQDEYPLHHLMPIKTIEKIKTDALSASSKIKNLDYEGVEAFLKEINNSIMDLNMKLDHERECKKEYDSKCEGLYYTSDCIIRNNSKVRKEIERLLQEYVQTDEIASFKEKCEKYLNEVAKDKQMMDNNIYGHQPYSVRLNNMNKLKDSIENFENHIETLKDLKESLKDKRLECLKKTTNYINFLRKSQIILRNCNLPSLTKKYKEKINNIENLISRLYMSLKVPYRVNNADEICKILDVECKDLYGKVKHSYKLMQHCEKIILIAARQRSSFQEVDYAVSRASFYFLDGDFESSKQIIEKLTSYGLEIPHFSDYEENL